MSRNKPNNATFRFNRLAKWLSVLIALGFWVMLKLSKEYKTGATFAIHWSIPDSLAWLDHPKDAIRINYEGTGWALLTAPRRKKQLNITLSEPGRSFALSRRQLIPLLEEKFPGDIQITDFFPDAISFRLDKKIQKKLPVKPNVNFQFEHGFTAKRNLTSQPDSVLAFGPKSLLQDIHQASTRVWNESNINTDLTKSLAVQINDYPTIEFVPAVTEVKLQTEQLTEKSFFIPITLLNVPDSVRIFPDRVKLSFLVPMSQYDHIEKSQFVLTADFIGIKKGSSENTLPIQIAQSPTHVSQIKVSPKSIEFFFKE